MARTVASGEATSIKPCTELVSHTGAKRRKEKAIHPSRESRGFLAVSCKEKAARSHTDEKAFGNGRSARVGAKHTQRPSLCRWIGRFITVRGDMRKFTGSSSMMCPVGHITTSHQLRSIRHAHPYYPDRDGSHHPELEPRQGIRRYPQAHYRARPPVNGETANLRLGCRCAPSPEDKRKFVLTLRRADAWTPGG
jgi:hypothetical protein